MPTPPGGSGSPRTLEDASCQTEVQAWDSRPGQDFLHQIQQTTQRRQHDRGALTGLRWLGVSRGRAAGRAAFARDPTGERGLLLPVRVADVTPLGLLRSRIYLDLVSLDEPAATTRLLAGVRLVLGHRARHLCDEADWSVPGRYHNRHRRSCAHVLDTTVILLHALHRETTLG